MAKKFFLRPHFWLLLLVGSLGLGFITRTADDFFEISKNMEIFGQVYTEVNQSYVDETNPTELMRTGLDAMLASLDPYTNYYSESQIEYAKLVNSGEYSSIGAEVSFLQGEVVITEVFDDGPAAGASLRIGDKLLQIDDISLEQEDLNLDEVRSLLAGERGSVVNLLIKRGDVPLALTIERGESEEQSQDVPYFGLIQEEIGYVLLTGFSGTAAAEVKAAIDSLSQKNENLKGLVLDLRGNPGGRLDQAVDICNLFIPQGELIVEMRGRTLDSRNEFTTRRPPWNTDIPVAVVVNSSSASASEIVAGALQDLDRGVIVGQRSFGKGLVQRVMPLTRTPQTQMKVTVAKYYTPSGRCIQALDYSNRNPDGSVGRVADSLQTAFSTRAGRTVYDGGGVTPDVKVELPASAPVLAALQSQNLFFDFANTYANQQEEIAAPNEFEVSDSLYQTFLAFVEKSDFDFNTATENQLKILEEALAKTEHEDDLQVHLEALHERLMAQKDQDLYRYQVEISERLRKEIVRRFYSKAGLIESSFSRDPDLLAAQAIIKETERYGAILRGDR